MELYAIVQLGSLDIVWAEVTTKENAEYKAVVFAVGGLGNCQLVSGVHLANILNAQADWAASVALETAGV